MLVQSCCFAYKTFCFLTFSSPSASLDLKVPTYEYDTLQREHKSRMDTRLSSLCHRFKQLHCTCDYYKNSFYPRPWTAQWNNLPPEIIASTSPSSFRQSLCYLTYGLAILCYCCIHCCNFYYLKQSAILCWEWRLNWQIKKLTGNMLALRRLSCDWDVWGLDWTRFFCGQRSLRTKSCRYFMYLLLYPKAQMADANSEAW